MWDHLSKYMKSLTLFSCREHSLLLLDPTELKQPFPGDIQDVSSGGIQTPRKAPSGACKNLAGKTTWQGEGCDCMQKEHNVQL